MRLEEILDVDRIDRAEPSADVGGEQVLGDAGALVAHGDRDEPHRRHLQRPPRRALGRDLGQEGPQPRAARTIEIARRLVREHDRRRVMQRPRQLAWPAVNRLRQNGSSCSIKSCSKRHTSPLYTGLAAVNSTEC
jgi:hypothetical protein